MFNLFNPPPYEIKMPDHNRNGNDASYQENKSHFKSQTEIVLNHLKTIGPVTSKLMIKLYDIIDTRARIYAIRKTHRVGERKVKGGNGSKEWFLIENVID